MFDLVVVDRWYSTKRKLNQVTNFFYFILLYCFLQLNSPFPEERKKERMKAVVRARWVSSERYFIRVTVLLLCFLTCFICMSGFSRELKVHWISLLVCLCLLCWLWQQVEKIKRKHKQTKRGKDYKTSSSSFANNIGCWFIGEIEIVYVFMCT